MPSHSFYENAGNISISILSDSIKKSFLQDENKLKQLNDEFNTTKKLFITQQKVHEQSLVEIQSLLSKYAELTSIISGVKNTLLSEIAVNVGTNAISSKLNSNYLKRLHNLEDFATAHKASIAPSSQLSNSQSMHSNLVVGSENLKFTELLNTSSSPTEVVMAEVVGMNAKTRSRMANVAKLREDIEKLRLIQSKKKQSKAGKYALVEEYDEDDLKTGNDLYTNNDECDESFKVSDGLASHSGAAMGNGISSMTRIREQRMYRRALWSSAVVNLSYQQQHQYQQQYSSSPLSSANKNIHSKYTSASLTDTNTRPLSMVSPGGIIIKHADDLKSWLHVGRNVTVDSDLPETPDTVAKALQPLRSDWEVFQSPLKEAISLPIPKLTFLPATTPAQKLAIPNTVANNSSGLLLNMTSSAGFFGSATTTTASSATIKSPSKPVIRKPSPSRVAAQTSERANSIGSEGGLFLSGEGGLEDDTPRSRKHSVSGDLVPSSPSFSVPSSPDPYSNKSATNQPIQTQNTSSSSKNIITEELCTIIQRFYDEEPGLEKRKNPTETRAFVIKSGTKTLKLLTDIYHGKFTKYVPEKYLSGGSPNLTSQTPSTTNITTTNITSSAATIGFGASKLPSFMLPVSADSKTNNGSGIASDGTNNSSQSIPSITVQIEQQIRAIYQEHKPDMLESVSKLMAKNVGKEIDLLRRIEDKYKVPAFTPITPAPAVGTSGAFAASTTATIAASSIASGSGQPFGAKPGASLFSAAKPASESATAPASSSLFSTPGRPSSSSTPFQSTPQQTQQTQQKLFGASGSSDAGSSLFGMNKQGSPANSLFGGPQVSTTSTTSSSTPPAVFGQPVPSGMAGSLNQSFGHSSGSSGSSVGFQPTAPTAQLSVPEITLKLRNIYTKYEPNKLNNIPSLLQKYAGKEMSLLLSVEKKYLFGGNASGGTNMSGVGVLSTDSNQPVGSSLFGGRNQSMTTVGTGSTGTPGLFGSGSAVVGAGMGVPPRQSGLFGASTIQNFSGTNTLTNSTSPGHAGMWGASSQNVSPGLFGSANQSTGNNFNNNNGGGGLNMSNSMFGQAQQQQQMTNAPSSSSGTGFGMRSSSLFGGSPTQALHQPQPQSSVLFSSNQQAGPSTLFGGNTQQQQASSSTWGSFR